MGAPALIVHNELRNRAEWRLSTVINGARVWLWRIGGVIASTKRFRSFRRRRCDVFFVSVIDLQIELSQIIQFLHDEFNLGHMIFSGFRYQPDPALNYEVISSKSNLLESQVARFQRKKCRGRFVRLFLRVPHHCR